MDPVRIERIVIVSHVTHFDWAGHLFAYGPYAHEIDIWADLFPQVVIAAPLRRESPPPNAAPFTRTNISVQPQIEVGGDALMDKVRLLAAVPLLAASLSRVLRRADAVHVRCPGNLGLLGACLAPLFSTRLVAKYAGQWPDHPGIGLSARIQKAVLRSKWWRGPVTVYGHWPHQPAHIVPFFTSILTAEQMTRARAAATGRRIGGHDLRVLYVGTLGAWKNVDTILHALRRLRDRGLTTECDIVGDGPARGSLERLAHDLGLGPAVRFAGAVSPNRVLDYYERADVLVLVSNSEGWPKAIAEAMAFGMACIGSDRGLIPEMLGEGRGLVVQPRDPDALASALTTIAASPDLCAEMRRRAAAWGQRYSIDDLRQALSLLLTKWWHVPVVPHALDDTPGNAACHQSI